MRRRTTKNQKGFVTVEFVLSVALLVFPVTMLVLTLPTWAERQSNARVSAREAARVYVLTADEAQARQVVAQMAQNQKFDPSKVTVTFEGDPREQGSEVRAIVTTEVPAVQVPILNAALGSFELTSTHAEPVDLYRSVPR